MGHPGKRVKDMVPFHDLSGGGGGGGGSGDCNCTLQQAYDNGQTIACSTELGPVVIKSAEWDLPTAIHCETPQADFSVEPLNIMLSSYSKILSEAGSFTDYNNLTIWSYPVSGFNGAVFADHRRWEVDNGTALCFWQDLQDGVGAAGGTATFLNPIVTTALDPLHSIALILSGSYWNGVSDTKRRAKIFHSLDAATPLSSIRFDIGGDEFGNSAGLYEALRINERSTAVLADKQSTIAIAWNNGGSLVTVQPVMVGAQGTGPGGGTTRALYLAS